MHRGLDDAGGHRVDAHIAAGKFDCQATGGAVQAAFDQDRQDGRHLGARLQRDAGGDGDDVAVTVRAHVLGGLLRWIEEAHQVGADDGVDFGFAVIGDGVRHEDAGVVDQDVDLTEGGNGFFKQFGSGGWQGDVAGNRQEVARVAELLGGGLQALQRTGVANHVVAALQIGSRNAQADTTRCAGNDDSFSCMHDIAPIQF